MHLELIGSIILILWIEIVIPENLRRKRVGGVGGFRSPVVLSSGHKILRLLYVDNVYREKLDKWKEISYCFISAWISGLF